MGEDDNVIVQNMSVSGDMTDRGEEKGDGSDEDDEVVMRRAAKVSADNSAEVMPSPSGARYEGKDLENYNIHSGISNVILLSQSRKLKILIEIMSTLYSGLIP